MTKRAPITDLAKLLRLRALQAYVAGMTDAREHGPRAARFDLYQRLGSWPCVDAYVAGWRDQRECSPSPGLRDWLEANERAAAR